MELYYVYILHVFSHVHSVTGLLTMHMMHWVGLEKKTMVWRYGGI